MSSNNKKSNLPDKIFNKFDVASKVIPSADVFQFFTQLTEAYKENQITQRDLAKIQATKEVLLTEITLKYELYRSVFDKIFTERDTAIKKFFSVIDLGIENNDRELISAGLQSLSKVVSSSPFTDLSQLSKALGSNNIIEI
jgi:hypothetical protein